MGRKFDSCRWRHRQHGVVRQPTEEGASCREDATDIQIAAGVVSGIGAGTLGIGGIVLGTAGVALPASPALGGAVTMAAGGVILLAGLITLAVGGVVSGSCPAVLGELPRRTGDRIVLSGMGAVCSLGTGRQALWRGIPRAPR